MSSFLSTLNALPVMIDRPGLYRTRSGEIVTVSCHSPRRAFEWSGAYPNGIAERWHRSGRAMPWSESGNDIVGVA